MIFEDLESWQAARQLTQDIYALTRADLIARDFGVCGQVQRAGVSVMSNIAEGFERQHLPEKVQFYCVAQRIKCRSPFADLRDRRQLPRVDGPGP